MASSISNTAKPSSSPVFPSSARNFHRDINCDGLRCKNVSFRRKTRLTRLYNRNIHSSSKEPHEDDKDDEKRRKISSWKKWAVGISLSLLLPSYRRKLGPLGVLINKVNEVVETTETVTEVVEDAAVDAKRLAEELERRLPAKDANGKLKEALDIVEKLAEETIKTTDLAQELMDKVEEAEERLEERIEERLEEALRIAEAKKKKQKQNENESSKKR